MEIALHVLIEEEVRQELGRRAVASRMSLSNYVRNVFDHHIETQTGFSVVINPAQNGVTA